MSSKVRIALAPGDGIGPEITAAALDLFRHAGVLERVEFVPVAMGRAEFDRGNTRGMSDDAIRVIEECGLLFKGPMETPKGGGGKSINVTARKMWGAFANLRHFKTFPGVPTVYSRAGIHVDFYVVRENIEDTYGGIEHRLSADVVQCKRLTSAPGSDQVHGFAFETARRLGIDRVVCGHKANIMKMTDGLFLERFREAAKAHPGIAVHDVIIDALCMNLVMRPQQYRMVVLPNLQGDIVSDLAAGLVGGLGFAPSANIGRFISIFEAVHGTAPDIAGRGIANPTAVILSGVMMLRHIGLLRSAALIENAVVASLEQGVRTGDFGDPARPALGTGDFVKAIAERLGRSPATIAPAPVPDQDRPSVTPPVRPAAPAMLRTFPRTATRIVGCDAYLEAADSTPNSPANSPASLAAAMAKAGEGSPFALTLISNRGTQVWPTGSVFTECVDYYRVRFELRRGADPDAADQAAVLALLGAIARRFTVVSYELLRTYDGQKGYSLAQGQ